MRFPLAVSLRKGIHESLGVVRLDTADDGQQLSLQLLDESSRVIFPSLHIPQLLLPYAGKLTALEQFVLDESYQLAAYRSGADVLPVPLDVVPLEPICV